MGRTCCFPTPPLGTKWAGGSTNLVTRGSLSRTSPQLQKPPTLEKCLEDKPLKCQSLEPLVSQKDLTVRLFLFIFQGRPSKTRSSNAHQPKRIQKAHAACASANCQGRSWDLRCMRIHGGGAGAGACVLPCDSCANQVAAGVELQQPSLLW